MIQNPILKGFCPDPSIVRVDNHYYIATSTFEWWPGVKLFHSKDLAHWTQIASPLRDSKQIQLEGNPPSGGVWAPCLSHDGEFFYLVYTDVKTKKGRFYNTHNYVIRAREIEGPWSEPIYLNSIGFDPSLFHDTDGKKYLVNMANGFRGIFLQELDPNTLSPIGERVKIYDGSGIGCTEGPHVYHIGAWYYLLVAEGGTGYEHCVTMARSSSLYGPYETAPHNPILTSNQADPMALQKCGHADLVETKDKEWYMVHLCARPLLGTLGCTLGRETAIQKMEWTKDGWLVLAGGGRFAKLEAPSPKGIASTKNGAEDALEHHFLDTFSAPCLDVRYSSPRWSYEQFADLQAREGYLRLYGKESLNSLHHVALLATRQMDISCIVHTMMEFSPAYTEQMAGLVYFYDALNYYFLGKTVNEEGEAILVLLRSDQGVIEDMIVPISLKANEPLVLMGEVSADGLTIRFLYGYASDDEAVSPQQLIQIEGEYSTHLVTDEYCRGFTGAHFGLYCHDMIGEHGYADFKAFGYESHLSN